MSKQDVSATCLYRGLVLDTYALAAAKLGCTNLIFVESGAVLPRRIADAEAATAICSIVGDVLVFQQDNAPAHCARDTVEFLRRETPQFISPDMWQANSPDLNPVDYHVWDMLQLARARVSSKNTQYGRVAEASYCDMG